MGSGPLEQGPGRGRSSFGNLSGSEYWSTSDSTSARTRTSPGPTFFPYKPPGSLGETVSLSLGKSVQKERCPPPPQKKSYKKIWGFIFQ